MFLLICKEQFHTVPRTVLLNVDSCFSDLLYIYVLPKLLCLYAPLCLRLCTIIFLCPALSEIVRYYFLMPRSV